MTYRKSRRSLYGTIGTLLWIGLFVGWTWRSGIPSLTANEWGDWAAGLAAPVAFLWLVLGYFQQGEELRLNTEALKAQQRELERQVRETAILAANSDRQAKAAEQMAFITREESERTALSQAAEAQPVFRSEGGIQTGASVQTDIANAGATVTNISVATKEPAVTISFSPTDVFEEGGQGKLQIHGATRFPFEFTLSYTDRLGKPHVKRLEMTVPHVLREVL